MCVFFFKQKTAYELRISYWSSDVCSSDLALEAEVELASRDGLRRLALDAFILGNRKTARRPDELVTAIIVPKPSGRARSRFLKLGARKYLVISIVDRKSVAQGKSVSVRVDHGGRRIFKKKRHDNYG